MTYPLSDDVSSGQPTASEHYNNLRADALRFGQAEADVVNLGAFFGKYSHNLNVVYLSSNRVRVLATVASPVLLMVQGYMLSATANVDLTSGAISGSAALWYIFANRADDETTFTLSANTSSTPSATQRLIGMCYFDGTNLVPSSIVLSDRSGVLENLKAYPSKINGGRLSLTSNLPITTSNVTGLTVYFIPAVSPTIGLYSNYTGWISYPFDEISIELPSTASKNYDIFAEWNGSAVELSYEVWTDDSNRASAITRVDGIDVLSGESSKRYLGSARVHSDSLCYDTEQFRFLWNNDNQHQKTLYISDGSTHTYGVSTWRYWNDDSDNLVAFFSGKDTALMLNHYGDQNCATAGAVIRTGIDMDASSSPDVVLGNSGGGNFKGSVSLVDIVTKGYHYASMLEYGNATYTCNFYTGKLQGLWDC